MSIQLLNGDCIEKMKSFSAEYVDLTVTSPPYDNLRDYRGYYFNFEGVAQELYRVTKTGGVVVWIVGDATVEGNETGTSFRQALRFKEIGFNLHDTMIYAKRAVGACGSCYSYQQAFEYMFVLVKGKLKCFNPIKDLISQRAGKPTRYTKSAKSNSNGYSLDSHIKIAPPSSKRQNIWTYDIGFGSGDDKTKHPAVFPELLAQDHILSWSNSGDMVLDPFLGSGTTGKMAILNGRNFIGIEISQEYLNVAQERINKATTSELEPQHSIPS
jgi:site-specific DNA-methyltransferase (adenine-specific)